MQPVKLISIDTEGGNDEVILGKVSIPAFVKGGSGNDSLSGGAGDDTLLGEGGSTISMAATEMTRSSADCKATRWLGDGGNDVIFAESSSINDDSISAARNGHGGLLAVHRQTSKSIVGVEQAPNEKATSSKAMSRCSSGQIRMMIW